MGRWTFGRRALVVASFILGLATMWMAARVHDQQEIDAMITAGVQARRDGDLAAALMYYNFVVIRAPTMCSAYKALGEIFLQISRNAEARTLLERALRCLEDRVQERQGDDRGRADAEKQLVEKLLSKI